MDIEVIYNIYFGTIIFILGLCLGSFLNCAAYRIARKESFVRGKSRCTSCGHELSAPDLIPVFSYLFSKGRCRYCGEHISVRYPVTEILFANLSLGIFLHSGLSVLTIRDLIFTSCLFLLAIVDIEIREIPDGCILISLLAWVVSAYFVYDGIRDILLHVAAGAVALFAFLIISLIMDHVLKKESLGGGDIKLFAVVGLYLGFIPLLFCVMIACILGLVFTVLLRKKDISFGPFIAIGAYFMILWGEALKTAYLGLLL